MKAIAVEHLVAMVDDADCVTVSAHKWRLHRVDDLTYAYTRIDGKTVYMHRLLTRADGKTSVDHANRNGLDNQRLNLRPCSHAENMRNRKRASHNRSGFKGVYFDPRNNVNPWRAQIRVGGKKICLGSFGTKEIAHGFYASAALDLHGNFARSS